MGRLKLPKEIQVKTWITRDRINRYRGILKLHARDKKLQLLQATKLKSVVSKKLEYLNVDVQRHREIVNSLSEGDKRHILRLLSDHRESYLAINRLRSSEICAAIYQDGEVKRRFLDKLYYEKKRKLKQTFELQLERNILSSDYEEQNDPSNCEQQQLIARLQRSITKYSTAKAIHSTYCSMLSILKKDAVFFDTLLNVLKEDQSSQCETMLRMTVMGQLAAENLDDIRQKYKQITRVIWRNMKIREHMLSTVRCQVQDLWAYAQSLVRVESDTVFARNDLESIADKLLENQLTNLEDVCDQAKETLLVHSYHDLLSRLEDQSRQRKNLLARLDINIKNRNSLLSQKNHALHVLESLKHSTKTMVEQYKTNGYDILEHIDTEKKREEELQKLKRTRGKLLTNIRVALQSMSTMLLHVKEDGKGAKKLPKDANKNLLREPDDKEDNEERETMLLDVEEMDTDVLTLLSKISRKAIVLFGMSNIDLDKNKENRARDLYQTYVANYSSKSTFGSGEEEPIGLFVEHEIVDATVLTRADIKLRSKQIVEAHLKPE